MFSVRWFILYAYDLVKGACFSVVACKYVADYRKMRRGSTRCKKKRIYVHKFHFLIKALSATLYEPPLCDWMILKPSCASQPSRGGGGGADEGQTRARRWWWTVDSLGEFINYEHKCRYKFNLCLFLFSFALMNMNVGGGAYANRFILISVVL